MSTSFLSPSFSLKRLLPVLALLLPVIAWLAYPIWQDWRAQSVFFERAGDVIGREEPEDDRTALDRLLLIVSDVKREDVTETLRYDNGATWGMRAEFLEKWCERQPGHQGQVLARELISTLKAVAASLAKTQDTQGFERESAERGAKDAVKKAADIFDALARP
jgi:hypothetical protein